MQLGREGDVPVELSVVFGFHFLGPDDPIVGVATRVGEFVEQAIEAAEIGVVAFVADSGDGVGEEADVLDELGAGQPQEESVVV